MEDKKFAELLIKSINLSDEIYLEFNTNIFYPEYEKCKSSLYLLADDFCITENFESLEERNIFLNKIAFISLDEFNITINENLYNLKFVERFRLTIEVNNIRQLIKDFELDIEKIELDGFLNAMKILQENYDLAKKVSEDLNLIFK